MARCCGSTGTCACKIVAGDRATVTGTGTSQDPFVVSSNVVLTSSSNTQFDLVLSGAGTAESPWTLEVVYAESGSLDGLPDVNTAGVANGYVLQWSDAAQAWVPGPPTTAAAGGSLTGQGIEGDGSAGAPLEVTADTARYISLSAAGVGLSDAGINSLVRIFPDATARAAASPAPIIGSVSMLVSEPGILDYWTGAQWMPVENGISTAAIQPGELLALSGGYVGGRVYQYVRQISVTTDINGDFDVIPAADLTNYAGVLSATVQVTGTVGWQCVVRGESDRIVGKAFRLDNGEAYGGYAVTAVVTGLLY